MDSTKDINKVCFKTHCFDVKIAKTKAEKRRGLSNREKLGENKGMLFIYPEERKLSFWMKDTLVPLDIIWINKKQKVIEIKHNAQPCKSEPCPSFSPENKAQYVLEINGGEAEKLGLKPGDRLKFKN